MTISQLTSNLANTSSPKSVQELAVLQATLFSLQQQQLLHMQILAQMQQAKESSNNSGSSENNDSQAKQDLANQVPMPNSIAELAKKMEVQNSLEPPTQPIIPVSLFKDVTSPALNLETNKQQHSRRDSTMTDSTPIPPSLPPKVSLASNMLTGTDLKPVTTTMPSATTPTVTSGSAGNSTNTSTESNLPLSAQILDPNAPPSLASSIIMHPEGSPEDKPVNSLELLQVIFFLKFKACLK